MNNAKQDAEDLVHAFGRAFEARDIEAILGFLDETIVYQNIPVPPLVGHDAVRGFLLPNLTAVLSMSWEFLATIADADGSQVLTERVDTFVFESGQVAVPLMGIFEIAGGKITKWRDYADIGTFVKDMRAIGRMPGPGVT
jgi:limonene-1,2-epoxide hydrolase